MKGTTQKVRPPAVRSVVGDIMVIVGRGPWPHAVRRFAGPEGMAPRYPCLPDGPWPLNLFHGAVVDKIWMELRRLEVED